ncbi:type II toxin-antitoxin system antitoxin DNA ADP-ribosyl glycohydrolase DarG [Chitinophaga jiangningensis]|nr:macro domain-containing protein [Chitinophaga jiangningensis]
MQFKSGNLFEAGTQALVNAVNTDGVMGKGIALQFKQRFPENFKAYAAACKRNEVVIGKMFVFHEETTTGEVIIINFPTKKTWRRKSEYSFIEAGLPALVDIIKQENISSIAIPPLGCGNGGLQWEQVKPMIEKYLSPLKEVDVQVFEPVS